MGLYKTHYEKQKVSISEVAKGIKFKKDAPKPQIILSVAPCRSGTTVLLRVFGAAGIESHYQEIKNILRWRMQKLEHNWLIPFKVDTLLTKETLGPYTLTESVFNPLEALLQSGYPKDKITVFIVGREPLETWASWTSWWRPVTNIEYLIKAYTATESIRKQAKNEGLLAATFVYSALRDAGVEKAVRWLFSKLGINYKPLAIQGWHNLPRFGQPGSKVIFPNEPPAFHLKNLHSQIEKANGLEYYFNKTRQSQIPTAEVDRIYSSQILGIYDDWCLECSQSIGVLINR